TSQSQIINLASYENFAFWQRLMLGPWFADRQIEVLAGRNCFEAAPGSQEARRHVLRIPDECGVDPRQPDRGCRWGGLAVARWPLECGNTHRVDLTAVDTFRQRH